MERLKNARNRNWSGICLHLINSTSSILILPETTQNLWIVKSKSIYTENKLSQ